MDEQIFELLKTLGQDGIQAFYIWMAVDYVSSWILIGLIAYGIRAVWNRFKDEI